jgi:hypothetical protein
VGTRPWLGTPELSHAGHGPNRIRFATSLLTYRHSRHSRRQTYLPVRQPDSGDPIFISQTKQTSRTAPTYPTQPARPERSAQTLQVAVLSRPPASRQAEIRPRPVQTSTDVSKLDYSDPPIGTTQAPPRPRPCRPTSADDCQSRPKTKPIIAQPQPQRYRVNTPPEVPRKCPGSAAEVHRKFTESAHESPLCKASEAGDSGEAKTDAIKLRKAVGRF